MAVSRTRQGRLTELEGAILSAVRRGDGITAYRLRQAFAASPSMEWSGSAGAVYPAMRRLKAAGLLAATVSGDARGTEHYKVTKAGEAALLAWAGDVARAVSAGTDPFRSRVPEWLLLGRARRAPMLRDIAKALTERCKVLEARLPRVSPVEREQARLELQLHRVRLRWIAKAK
jgi:DNA-binding PadR family transcriptional regulator